MAEPRLLLVLQHYARPDCTRRQLEALARCRGIASCSIVAQVDAVDRPEGREIRDLIAGFRAGSVAGVDGHGHRGCEPTAIRGFDRGAALGDFFVHLDDDVLLAPDALEFFAWARDRYRDDPSVFSVSAYHVRRDDVPPAGHRAARRVAWFGGSAMGTWRDRYLAARPTVCEVTGTDPDRVVTAGPISGGWDAGMWAYARPRGLVQVLPALSRAQNIGVRSSIHPPDGFFTPEWHRDNQHCPFWAGDGREIAPGDWHEADHA